METNTNTENIEHTIFQDSRWGELEAVSHGWLKFDSEEDEESAYEGFIYRAELTRDFWAGTYHTAVGLVTYSGPFPSLTQAENFMYSEGFENFSG